MKRAEKYKLFPQMTNSYRWRNFVEKIKINGFLLPEEDALNEGYSTFQYPLVDLKGQWLAIDGLQFEVFDGQEAEDLKKRLLEGKIHGKLMNLRSCKASSPKWSLLAI